MFYEPRKRDHGLPHDPFKSCIVPRPIGWISTVSGAGIRNLAPYSFFNAVAWAPPMVMFASPHRGADGTSKDTIANVEETGVFVVNLATEPLLDAVNRSSLSVPPDVDEFTLTGLEAAECQLVAAPRVARAPINMECRLVEIVRLPSRDPARPNALVIGEVVGVHIADDALSNGRVDIARLKPLARLGYRDWAVVDQVFPVEPAVLTDAG